MSVIEEQPKQYTANARIPNRLCPCCGEGIRNGMPIYYVPNVYGLRVLDDYGRASRSAAIHKRCLSVYRLSC